MAVNAGTGAKENLYLRPWLLQILWSQETGTKQPQQAVEPFEATPADVI